LRRKKNTPEGVFLFNLNRLLEDLGYDASTYGTAAFANREAQTFVHRDRRD
jgi:hypothetical protein